MPMQLRNSSSTAAGAMQPIPAGVPCPDKLRAASDAYVAAGEPVRVAAAAWNRAREAAADAGHADQREKNAAIAAGRRPALTSPQAQAAEGEAKLTLERAQHALGLAELAFADALFEVRNEWLLQLADAQKRARAHRMELLEEMEPVLTEEYVLEAVASRLRAWRYDSEAPPHDRLARVRDGLDAKRRPDFSEAERERARSARRIQNVREAAERNPDAVHHVSSGRIGQVA